MDKENEKRFDDVMRNFYESLDKKQTEQPNPFDEMAGYLFEFHKSLLSKGFGSSEATVLTSAMLRTILADTSN